MTTEKILVIDDEPQILWLVSRFLRKLEYDVQEARSGKAALEKLSTTPFALILSDLKMPAIDGLQILELVKTNYPDTIFIMMTAFATIDLTISALRKGVYDFLTKPLDLKELALTVQQALQHRRLSLQNQQLMESLKEKNLVLETLHRTEHRKAEQLRRINAISRQITAILDVERLVDTVIHQASKTFDFETLSFGVIERGMVTFWGRPLAGQSEPVEQSLFWTLTRQGHQVFVHSQTPSPTNCPYDLIFPLRAADQLVGFWVAVWKQDAEVREENLPYLESLAAQTAIVLENAHLYTLAERADELAFINRIGAASKQSLNLKETIQSVLICVQSLYTPSLHAQLVEICLFDEQGHCQQAFSLVGNDFFQSQTSILGTEFVARVGAAPLILYDRTQVGRLCPQDPAQLELHSILGVPLNFGAHPIGVLSVAGDKPYTFNVNDGRLLQIAGRQVAMAIENARLFHQVEDKQNTIEASRNTLLAVFDSILDGIYIIDRNRKILAINRTQAGRTGHTFGQLVGQPAEQAFPESQRAIACIEETFANGQPTTHTERIPSNTGPTTEWNIHTYPVSNDGGELDYVVVVARDVTEQRQLEASLIQAEKMASVGQLAAGIAHEINNPMTVISANIQILREELPAANLLYESVELIDRASTRAAEIVRNLLRFSRPEQFEFAPIDLNLSITDTLSLVRQQLTRLHIDLVAELAPDLPPIWASINYLRIVWLNLILNARDAICEKQDGGTIKITSARQEECVIVQISDDGIGIPHDVLKRIYDPFFTTKPPDQGTGLGLFNCYRAVEQHHGEIRAKSKPEIGTTFEIRLPIQQQI